MSAARLVAHQLHYDLLAAWRDPRSRFFTIALPVIFLILLSSVFGDHATRVGAHAIKNSTYYLPGICTLGIVAISFVNLVITITAQRESGVLKRRRSTPVPAWVLIAGRTLTAVVTALVLMVVLVAIGRIAYGVRLPGATIPGFLLAVVIGTGCFCCLSFAVASFIRAEDSAQPIIQATVLPLYSSRASSYRARNSRARFAISPTSFPSATSTAPCSRPSTRPPRAPGSRRTTC